MCKIMIAVAAATVLGLSAAAAAPVNGSVFAHPGYGNASVQQVWWGGYHHHRHFYRHHYRRWW